MKKFTVVLILPDYAAEQYGESFYAAQVEAKTFVVARHIGQQEAMEAWLEDNVDADELDEQRLQADPEDWRVAFIFEGHPEILSYGD